MKHSTKMWSFPRYCLLALLLLVSLKGHGAAPEGYFLDSLDNRTGLLSVKCIGQDADGLIWFGTDKGLYNYDGYSVKSFRGLISNVQTRCVLPIGQEVLVGCNGGMWIFDTVGEQFHECAFFKNDVVNTIVRDGEDLYIGADSGLYRVHSTDLDNPQAYTSLHDGSVRTMLLRKDRLWTGSFRDYGYYSFADGKYYPFSFEGGRSQFVSTIYAENDSTLWLGTSRNMIRLDSPEYTATQYLPMIVLQTIIRDGRGGYLLGTDAGLLYHDPSSGETVKLRDGIYTSSFMDRVGNYWLGTDNGLLLLRKERPVTPLARGGLPSHIVMQMVLKDTKDRLWAGGLDGLQLYEKQDDGHYAPSTFFSVGSATYSVPQKVNKLVEDEDTGEVYAVTDGGLLKFNEETGRFDRSALRTEHNWVYDVLIDGSELWLASYDGLYHAKDGAFVSRISMADGISSNDVAQVTKDRSGHVWFLTRDQMVYYLEPVGGVPQKFPLESHIGIQFADYLLSDSEGMIWIAAGNELIQVLPSSEQSEIREIILPANPEMDVYSLSDFRGRIWVCSSDGVFFVNKNTESIGRFSVNKSYVCLSYDREAETLYAGSIGGVDAIPFSEIERLSERRSHPVFIRSVSVNDERFISKKELSEGRIVLENHENSLDITFSDYRYGSGIPRRYVYRITGQKSPWREVQSNNVLSLSNLQYGRYSLQIASGSPLEDTPELLQIRIKRPFYQSGPMVALYLLVLVGLMYLFGRFAKLQNNLKVERKERDLLLKQFREKEDFFTNISHEFKTPLSLIIAPLNKLLHDGPQDSETRKMLSVAHDNATKLNGLVHNTLDYYRKSEDSPKDLLKIDVDFVDFVKTIFDSFKENYPKHEFIFSSNRPSMVVSIDFVKMEMAVNNLLSNACKYTPEGGSVILTMEQDEESGLVSLKVSDTGVGIPPEDLPRIFQRYYESSRTQGGSYDSTGIGLSIIKNVVENHGGRIAAESDDSGSTFTMVLPCKKTQAVEDTGQGKASDGAEKPLIVIVEDNVQMSQFLENVLSEKYKCISSSNGKSGLKLCKDVIPDLIIADVMMPVMDGLQMCREIRECKPLSLIPIIMLTAMGDVETEKKSIDLNIEAFVPKPFDLTLLLSKIDQLIGNKQRIEQKLRQELITVQGAEEEVSPDERFLQKVTGIIEEHIDDSEFSVGALCEEGVFNEKQLYRKVKQMTGLSTAEYIRSIRLKKAAILLQNGNFTISEVMYSVGFSNASYFTRAFSAEFGKTPSEYKKCYLEKRNISDTHG